MLALMISAVYLCTVLIYLCVCLHGKRALTPSAMFVGFQTIMYIGLIPLVDQTAKSDILYLVAYLVALVSFILGSEVHHHCSNIQVVSISSSKSEGISKAQKELLFSVLIVSLLVCVLFFASSGSNVFIMALRSLLEGSEANYTEQRLANNAVSGVGYVYQFRVILLPLITFYLIFSGNRLLRKIGLVVLPLMLLFVLGTGQRGGFVLAIASLMVALININVFYKKRMGRVIVLFLFAAIVLFAIMTVFNGRVQDGQNVIQSIVSRIFDANQGSGIVAWRYIITQECQMGHDWLMSVLDILPGKNNYTDLAYSIFEIMYGSTRGTAPPCIWGSVYYNFGWLGLMIFPCILGYFLDYLYCRFISRPITVLRIFCYSFMYVAISSWVAGTIMQLFNQGFITVVILSFLLHIDRPQVKKPGDCDDHSEQDEEAVSPVSV